MENNKKETGFMPEENYTNETEQETFNRVSMFSKDTFVIAKLFKSERLKIEAPTDEIIKLIDGYWKFDEYQYNLSSWHNKQDLIRAIKILTRI